MPFLSPAWRAGPWGWMADPALSQCGTTSTTTPARTLRNTNVVCHRAKRGSKNAPCVYGHSTGTLPGVATNVTRRSVREQIPRVRMIRFLRINLYSASDILQKRSCCYINVWECSDTHCRCYRRREVTGEIRIVASLLRAIDRSVSGGESKAR